MAFGTPSFRYRQIGDAAFLEIAELIERGESTVILGPRGAGKRYLFALLRRRWGRQQRPFHRVRFDGRDLICREEDAVDRLVGGCDLTHCDARTFEQFDTLLREQRRENLLLMVSNVDGLSRDLARRFLATLRGLVQDRILTAIITGESNLVDLVHGPNSEFNCAHQFVVHARDRKHFRIFLGRRLRLHQFVWPRKISEARRLVDTAYRLTGGDIALLRAQIWCASDDRMHHLKSPPKKPIPFTEEHLAAGLMELHLIPAGGLAPFHYAVDCVESDRESWLILHYLLLGVPWHAPDNSPTPLELSGLVRRNELDYNRLGWASIYAEKFARGYFTERRMGDLFASIGDWARAFGWYEKVSAPERMRPLNDEDVLALNRVFDALTIELNRIASGPAGRERIVELKELLRLACRDIFGLSEVVFWRRIGGQWTPERPTESNTGMARQVALAAQTAEESAEGCFDDGACWAICSHRREDGLSPEEAVVVSADPSSLFPSRRRALLRLLAAFRHAWEHASLVAAMHARLAHRRILLSITQESLHGLGSSDWSVRRVVQHGAQHLVSPEVGVTRAVVFLRHRGDEPEKLQLAWDTSAPATDQLPNPISDALLVATLRQSEATAFNAQQAEAWSRFVMNRFDGPVVAVPLGERPGLEGKQGVLVCEIAREDDITRDMLDGLGTFGARLGIAVELARKFTFLQDSLDSMIDPTLILNAGRQALFLNEPAKGNFGLSIDTKGWLPRPTTLAALGMSPAVTTTLTKMLSPQKCVVRVDDLTDKMPGVWLGDVHPLNEWNGEPAGWFLHLRDRAFFFKAFELMRAIEQADTVEGALRTLARKMTDFRLGKSIKLRVFVIDPDRPEVLKSFNSAGLDAARAAAFARGAIEISRDRHQEGWLAILESHSIVFRWQPDHPEGKGHTNRGLRYRSVHRTNYVEQLQKSRGDFWVDVPLFIAGAPFGKLTITLTSEDGERLVAEINELLQALSFVIGELIERLHRDFTFRANLKASADEALAQTAHNLVSKLAGMPSLIGRYRLHEEERPSLKPVNDDFGQYYEHAVTTLRRIKDRVGAIRLETQFCDLADIVERALKTVISDGAISWSWEGGKPCLMGEWDPMNTENVFIELAHDSRVFAHPDRPLRVIVNASIEDANTPKEKVRLTYRDNGRGVPDDRKEAIFTLGTTFREQVRVPGSGIGLHYVRRVVAARGGTIVETGVPGEGARFEFVLPTHVPKPETSTETTNL
jgi:hypothetical protein